MLPRNNFNSEELANWGMLHQARREAAIDDCIKSIPPPPANQHKAILSEWCQQQKIDSTETLMHWQKQRGFTSEQWKRYVVRKSHWTEWCRQNLKSKLDSYYLERKSHLDQVIYSLLRVKDEHLANELHLRIKEGESSFEEVAEEYSEGPERKHRGRVGPMPLSQPHPMLSKLLKASEPGQLWPPKQLENWWIVVRLEEFRNAELNNSLKEHLLNKSGDEYLEEQLLAIKSKD